MKLDKPEKTVEPDKNCPFYGSLKVRGKAYTGKVVSTSLLSANVKLERTVFVPKYRRYKKAYSKIRCHNPAVLSAKVGDTVQFMACRPISKTKSNVIVKIVEQ